MSDTLKVTAARAGVPCPKSPRPSVRMYMHENGERRDRTCIYHDEVVEVEDSRYYRRRIIKGDLKLATVAPAKRETTTAQRQTVSGGKK